ncbi:MAG: phage integrase N-terminal SAM-like domain-containing protein [Gammaproteobacteria bacterium]|nr:phage integrase N-terminal SAM-like domain-containing protein [Gammaproteobacteria bacterium]
MLVRRYSKRTVSTYTQRIRSYIRFHQRRHPRHMVAPEVVQLLTYLTTSA